MIKSVHILGHLGLGDHILCNGLVRNYSKFYDRVVIPAYHHNMEAVELMFHDLKNVEVVRVKDDAAAILLCHEKNCLRLGYYNKENPPFNPDIFDQEFYRQARIPFESRWDDFKCDLSKVWTDGLRKSFIHDDAERGFSIRKEYFNGYDNSIYIPHNYHPFWHHAPYLKNATEIHCINSSFLILADSFPDREDQKLFFHHYARPTKYPKLKRNWEIIS